MLTDHYYSTEEAATYLGITSKRFKELIEANEIATQKNSDCFLREDLNAFADRKHAEAQAIRQRQQLLKYDLDFLDGRGWPE